MTMTISSAFYPQNLSLRVLATLLFTASGSFFLTAQNVGIGTTTPTEKLHVEGNSYVSGTTRAEAFTMGGGNTFQINSAGQIGGRFFVGSDGNVGVGTNSPIEKLQVNGNIQMSGGNRNIFGLNALRGSSGGLHLQGDANSNSDLFVAPNGRIGINNMTNPTHQLHINGSLRVETEVSVGSGSEFLVDAPNVQGGRFRILPNGQAGFRDVHSNVSLNVQSQAGDEKIFVTEGATGVNVLEVQNDGEVQVFGNFFVANGSKNFITDHPLDPANKTLQHACVESNEVLNVYSGTVTLDGQGKITIKLPDYFEALNKDFRYQLTCIGGFAPVFVAKKIANNQFDIAGGTPGLEVSWQVTGVRNDAWFRDHPYRDVLEKTGRDKGRYFYPEGFGQPAELGLAKAEEGAKK